MAREYNRAMNVARPLSVSSPKLIGRQAQLALLADLIARARAGQSCIALIGGEAGIGKSRLAAEVQAGAAPGSATILVGRCFEQDRTFPFAPLIDLLRSFCAARSAAELTRALGANAVEFVKILPELSAHFPDLTTAPSLDPEQEKRRLFQALTQFLQQQAAAKPPLLLVFEDLNWCDDTGLEWLLYFSRRMETHRVMLLLTYRSDEIHPALNQLLAALDRMPFVRELVLPNLTRAEVDALLRAIFDLPESPRAEFLDALYALTEGNPFFIEEVCKSLIASGDIYQIGGEWTRKPLSELEIPRTVQVAVRGRTRQLSAGAQHLLTLAAVAGQRFDFRLLEILTRQSESELLRQVKELIAAHLVVEESDEIFAFRHALTRQAIEGGLLARERKALHRAVAEALEVRYGDAPDAHAGELAHHFFEAGLWRKAMEWSRRSGDHATALYAHGEALSHYTLARDCADKLGLPAQVAALDQVIGDSYHARGDMAQAAQAYERALQAENDPARRAVLKGLIGAALANVADERGLEYLHAALAELDPATQTKQIGAATLWLGRFYFFHAEYARAIAYLERARALCEPLDDIPTLHRVYTFLSAALLYPARFQESKVWARRSIALSETRRYLPAASDGYEVLAANAVFEGRWQQAQDFGALGSALARQAGWLYEQVWNDLLVSISNYHQGNLETGMRLARECAALATELSERRVLLWANQLLAMYETALGREDVAFRMGEATLRESREHIEASPRARSLLALALLHAQREEWAEASRLYEQCAELLAGTEIRVVQMELDGPRAEAYGALGRLDQAALLIDQTLSETRDRGARHNEAVAWRVKGQIHAAQGRSDDSLQAFAQAVLLDESLGSRPELARALYERGALHLARRDETAALADWTRARTLCEEMGARALLWRIHAALGRLALERHRRADAETGLASARSIVDELAANMQDASSRENLLRRAARQIPAAPPVSSRRAVQAEFGGLTGREREVAILIAQGKSNREIAEALVVSPRTITAHVSNILGKLGFASRAQVARWAGERGLVKPISD